MYLILNINWNAIKTSWCDGNNTKSHLSRVQVWILSGGLVAIDDITCDTDAKRAMAFSSYTIDIHSIWTLQYSIDCRAQLTQRSKASKQQWITRAGFGARLTFFFLLRIPPKLNGWTSKLTLKNIFACFPLLSVPPPPPPTAIDAAVGWIVHVSERRWLIKIKKNRKEMCDSSRHWWWHC